MTENIGLGEHTLEYKVRTLAEARRIAEAFKADMETKRLVWMEEQQPIIEAVALSVKAVADLEASIRAQAVAAYNADPQKQKDIGWGVKVREVTKLSYDPETALNWAVQHNMALSLNVKGFEALAKLEPAQVPFVTIAEEPVATIAQDLQKVLGGEKA